MIHMKMMMFFFDVHENDDGMPISKHMTYDVHENNDANFAAYDYNVYENNDGMPISKHMTYDVREKNYGMQISHTVSGVHESNVVGE